MRILAIGPLWRGSNAGGLFRAFSRQGIILDIADEFYYISLQTRSKSTKIAERLIRPMQTREFNDAIISKIRTLSPDVLFVYKGAFVYPATLQFARTQGCKLVLFYPDVSMMSHGDNIPKCIPLYDLIFTTKTFGINDINNKYGVRNTYFIPHGFDPEVHRKLPLSEKELQTFGCDASFIGTWSAKKEKYLTVLKNKLPSLNLNIWGSQWERSSSEAIRASIRSIPVVGDLYALAIQCSAVNLGILSEQVPGASSGDLITSRTFHIPAASGFMLHERNAESVLYFRDEEEAVFFDTPDDMAEKAAYYLQNEGRRKAICEAGQKRAWQDHSLDARAKVILEQIKAL